MTKLKDIPNESVDFIFTCPPYYNLEKYTNIDGDLSLMSDDDFDKSYESIIAKSIEKLKPNRLACMVVGEVRNNKGFYKNLINKTVSYFEKHGCNFYNDIVMLRPIANGAMRANRQFSQSRKVVRIHQNVLVFYKGTNHKSIKDIQFNSK